MDVASVFQDFCSNLTINNKSDISDRYKRLTKRLNWEFYNQDSDQAHSFYTGSYGRGTASRSISDLDMIFVLPFVVYTRFNGYQSNGQSALLQEVRDAIKKSYTYTDVGADGQVVVVPFTDGITFEVVPAFLNDDDSYTYPDANNGGKWKTTNPKPEIQEAGRANKAYNGNFVELARMARSWKEKWDVPIGGLLLDTLVNNFLSAYEGNTKSYLYHDWLCRDFFKFLSECDQTQNYWYALGSNQLAYRKGLFEYKAKRCYNISLGAIEHDRKQENWSAHNDWREIFGTRFPEAP